MFQLLDLLGVFFFAISGVLAGVNKRLDPFGVFIIAFVTALGGGTLRDMLIGRTPVGWMRDINYVHTIFLAFIIGIIFKQQLYKLRVSLFLFDTVGLGISTLIGLEKGILKGLDPIVCIALGTMTASFGGVIRDILCNEIPVIFRREIYATVCILGGVLFFILRKFSIQGDVLYLSTALFIIVFRICAVKFKWSLKVISLH